jgi:hypothetical protein
MANKNSQNFKNELNRKVSVPKVITVFFALYFGAFMLTYLLICLMFGSFEFREYFFPLLAYFPMGIFGIILGEKAGIPGLIVGYAIYLLTLISMFLCRNQKKFKYIVVAFILILILNISGCVIGIFNLDGFAFVGY